MNRDFYRCFPGICTVKVLLACTLLYAFSAQSESGHRIAIDIGHSLENPGSVSARGVGEYYFNRRFARELLIALDKRGFEYSFLINEEGNLDGRPGMEMRRKIAVENDADVLISIHHDSVQPESLETWMVDGEIQQFSDIASGYSIILSRKSIHRANSWNLAICLARELRDAGLHPNDYHALENEGENRNLIDPKRGIYDINFWLPTYAGMYVPTIILEVGVIVNREEELKLSDPRYRARVVEAICAALENYFVFIGQELSSNDSVTRCQ